MRYHLNCIKLDYVPKEPILTQTTPHIFDFDSAKNSIPPYKMPKEM
jgi:hypothetical protein